MRRPEASAVRTSAWLAFSTPHDPDVPQYKIAQEAAVLLRGAADLRIRKPSSRMTGFDAKKVGERISQASSGRKLESATGSGRFEDESKQRPRPEVQRLPAGVACASSSN